MDDQLLALCRNFPVEWEKQNIFEWSDELTLSR